MVDPNGSGIWELDDVLQVVAWLVLLSTFTALILRGIGWIVAGRQRQADIEKTRAETQQAQAETVQKWQQINDAARADVATLSNRVTALEAELTQTREEMAALARTFRALVMSVKKRTDRETAAQIFQDAGIPVPAPEGIGDNGHGV